MAKFNDLTGKVFGRLTVLRRGPTKNTKIFWVCKCLCGNEHIVSGFHLVQKKTTSCGCYRVEVHSLDGDEGSFREVFRYYTGGARQRGHSFELNEKQFREISQKSCEY